jgi:hypothetical protein
MHEMVEVSQVRDRDHQVEPTGVAEILTGEDNGCSLANVSEQGESGVKKSVSTSVQPVTDEGA